MFERYTEPAKRALFFARYEASMFGSRAIETEHLLLGLLRDHQSGGGAVLSAHGLTLEQVRRDIIELLGRKDGTDAGGP